MENNIKMEIDSILKETTQFDFPFFSNQEKKKNIVIEKKCYIEEKLKIIAPRQFPCEEKRKELWNKSVEHADDQFKSLTVKNRLNGFYLQELMHYYAEQLGDNIIDND